MEIDVNVHDEKVLSLCDSELIGRTLKQDNFELIITERFYKGEKIGEKHIIALLKEAGNVNIVGENSVKLALKAKAITKDGIREIDGVPIAQIYSIE